MNIQLPVKSDIVLAGVPTNVQAGALTGKLLDIGNADGYQMIFALGAGAAGQNVTVRLEQSKAADGSDAKELKISRAYYKKGATVFAKATDVFVRDETITPRATAATFTVPAGGDTGEVVVVLDIQPHDLDTENGFRYVRGIINTVGGAGARYGTILAVPTCFAYGGLGHESLLAV